MEAKSAPKELIDQFVSITQAENGQASFYLEAANNDLNEAVSQYFSSNPNNLGRIGQEPPKTSHQPQEMYAGGASKHGGSGQNVIDPKDKKGRDDLIADMFKSAKESGAEQMEQSRSSGNSFGGGSNNMNNESKKSPAKEKIIVLKMWKNGFTVGEPESEILQLRGYEEPDNQQFMESIKKGEVPNELRAQVQNGNVALDMEDHRDEDYTPPKVILFSGGGNQMGSSAPIQTTTNITASDVGDFELVVNESEPTTNIRIRLSTGKTVVQQFNKSHLVADLRKFIARESGREPGEFNIMMSYPRKTLTEDNVGLEEAGLLGSQVIQQ